ncbi:retrovirus-related pol polyprotein from transposon TNT 1-94 [Tanacetum coccineum]
MDKKVKIIRSDNETEFKNKVMNDFCREKGIKREYSVARTPQQNGVVKRRNRTPIEAARTMLADFKLPTTFWAEAVSTACYVQNKVLVVKPHNKTPYELFRGFKLALSFMKPFGCHVTILNTLDSLGKFDSKSDKDMSTMGDSSTLEATHIESFSDEDEPEVDLGNITNSYTVPTTPNTRIHKDHPIDNVIGDVKSSVQTRRMTKPTSEQGFLSDVYEQKTHDTLNTCLYACFLSQIEPTSLDTGWSFLPNGKKAIGTKWVFKNKKDERDIVIRNKARSDHQQSLQGGQGTLRFASSTRAWYETWEKPVQGIGDANDVNVHLYRSTIRSNTHKEDYTGGCQFLGNRLISWQCKKQTVVATSTTEAEYVAAASCCGQVLWIQNQLLDYRVNTVRQKITTARQKLLLLGAKVTTVEKILIS